MNFLSELRTHNEVDFQKTCLIFKTWLWNWKKSSVRVFWYFNFHPTESNSPVIPVTSFPICTFFFANRFIYNFVHKIYWCFVNSLKLMFDFCLLTWDFYIVKQIFFSDSDVYVNILPWASLPEFSYNLCPGYRINRTIFRIIIMFVSKKRLIFK